MYKFIVTATYFLLSLLNAQTLGENTPLAFPILNTIIDPKSLSSIKLIKQPIVVKIKAGQYSGLILSPALYNQSKNEQQPLLPLVGFNPNYKVQSLPSWGSFSVVNNTLSLNPPESFNEPIHTQIFFSDPKNNSANLSVTFQPYFSNLGAQKFSLIANSSFDRKPGVWTLAYPIYVLNQQNLNNARHVLDSAFMIDQAISPWTTLTNLITPQYFLSIQNNENPVINIPPVINQQTNPFDPNNLTIINHTTVTVTNTSYPSPNQIITPQIDYNNLNNNFNTPNFASLINNNNISLQQNQPTPVPFSGIQTINTTTTAYFPTSYVENVNTGFPFVNNNYSPTNSLPLNTAQVVNTAPIFNQTNTSTQLVTPKTNDDSQYNYVPLIFDKNSAVPIINETVNNNISIQKQPKQSSFNQTVNTQPLTPSINQQNSNFSMNLPINHFENTHPTEATKTLPLPSTVNISIPQNRQLNTLTIPLTNTSIINPSIVNSEIKTTPISTTNPELSIQNAPQFLNISDITVNSPVPSPSPITSYDQISRQIAQPTSQISIVDLTNTTNKEEKINPHTQIISVPQTTPSTAQLTPALVKQQDIKQQHPTTLPQQTLSTSENATLNQTSLVPLPLPELPKFPQFDLSAFGIDMSKLNTTPPISSNVKPVELILPNITTPTHIGLDTNHDIATPITMSFPEPSYVANPKVSPIQIEDFSHLLNQTGNNALKPVQTKFIDLTNNVTASVKQTVNNITQKIGDIVKTTPKNQ